MEFQFARRAMIRDRCGISKTARRAAEACKTTRRGAEASKTSRRAVKTSHISRWAEMKMRGHLKVSWTR
jgi:hypothetical protein